MIGVAHLVRTRHGSFVEARAGRRIAYGPDYCGALVAAVLAYLNGPGRQWGAA